jgi:hypothetical protein
VGKPNRGAFAGRTLRTAFFVLAALFAAASSSPAKAADVSLPDLEAAARSLGFLDSLACDGTLVLGIVYASDSPDAKALASALAERVRSIKGHNSAVFKTEVLSVNELAQFSDRLDAIFLAPGTTAEAGTIAEIIRRRHLVSISNDPACLQAKCCVLMIRTDRGVEINLDTSLADAVGARFSPVFSMMVKRR